MNAIQWLVTCEHASHEIPQQYQSLFRDKGVLKTHRGYDIGAIDYANVIAHELHAPLLSGEWSRLLIELNRSLHSNSLFSEYTKELSEQEKKYLIENYYTPYRTKVLHWIQSTLKNPKNLVVHLSCHTFTPVLDDIPRKTAIGILYDPLRKGEKHVSHALIQALREMPHAITPIHANRPYRGTSDGHTTFLRTVFPETVYLGIEVEIASNYLTNEQKKERIFTEWIPYFVTALQQVVKENILLDSKRAIAGD